MSRQQLKEKGFTIIEVVLVLAIAALIFLMVFIALPALQRSQRDTARKNDVSIVSSAVTSYQSANRGANPSDATAFAKYVGTLSGNSELGTVGGASDTEVTATDGKIDVYTSAKCGDPVDGSATKVKITTGSKRNIAIVTLLESGGGDGTAYCQDL